MSNFNFKYYYYLILGLAFFFLGNEVSADNIRLENSIFPEGQSKVYISVENKNLPLSNSEEYPNEGKEEESEVNTEEGGDKNDADKNLDEGNDCNTLLPPNPQNLHLQAIFSQNIAAVILPFKTAILGHNQALYLLFCVFLC